MHTSKPYQEACQRAITWLLRSQWLKGKFKGFVPKVTFPFFRFAPYPEITGYSTSLLLKLYRINHNDVYLHRARLAVSALKNIELINGAYNSIASRNKHRIIFFDHSIILNGLIDYYSVTKDHSLLGSIGKAVSFILKNQRQNGSIHEKIYFDRPHFALAKTALPLVKLYEITGEEKYLESTFNLVKYIIDHFQKDDGGFRLNVNLPHYNRTHFLCYTLEGLIALDKYYPELSSRIENACGYLVRLHSKKDFVPYAFHSDGTVAIGSPDLSATAQTARIMLFMYNKVGEENYCKVAQKYIEYLLRRQRRLRYSLLYGGIPHGHKPVFNLVSVCSWATMFMIDSLLMLLYPELRDSITF